MAAFRFLVAEVSSGKRGVTEPQAGGVPRTRPLALNIECTLTHLRCARLRASSSKSTHCDFAHAAQRGPKKGKEGFIGGTLLPWIAHNARAARLQIHGQPSQTAIVNVVGILEKSREATGLRSKVSATAHAGIGGLTHRGQFGADLQQQSWDPTLKEVRRVMCETKIHQTPSVFLYRIGTPISPLNPPATSPRQIYLNVGVTFPCLALRPIWEAVYRVCQHHQHLDRMRMDHIGRSCDQWRYRSARSIASPVHEAFRLEMPLACLALQNAILRSASRHRRQGGAFSLRSKSQGPTEPGRTSQP